MEMTVSVDTSALSAAIPRLVAFGRRTLRQQCVTSGARIVLDAQELTPAADIGRIDAKLEVESTPRLSTRGARKGQPLKDGGRDITVPKKSNAMMVVLARMHPGSHYNQVTGGRWALAKPDINVSGIGRVGRGSSYAGMKQRDARAFWEWVRAKAELMVKARHSSTHYIQHGWQRAISVLLGDPDCRLTKRKSTAAHKVNPRNMMDAGALGDCRISGAGDLIMVTAENNVGEVAGGSNAVLAARHRDAALKYGEPAAQAAVGAESAVCEAQIEKNFALGLKQDFSNL